MAHLYSLCCLNDGFHWILISVSGAILACSQRGFSTEEEALIDLQAYD